MFPRRDMRTVYIAHRALTEREDGKKVYTYGEPVAVLGSLGTLSANRAIQLFGEKSGNTYRFVPDPFCGETFAVGDRVWIDNAIPSELDIMASNADYSVESVYIRSSVVSVLLKRV